MFDIFKVFNDNKAVLAEIPRFVNAWIDFMNKLHERLTRFEAALERHDSKLQTVIEIVSDGHPATVTPELHAVVETWAADDPRNNRAAFIASLVNVAGKSEAEATQIWETQNGKRQLDG